MIRARNKATQFMEPQSMADNTNVKLRNMGKDMPEVPIMVKLETCKIRWWSDSKQFER